MKNKKRLKTTIIPFFKNKIKWIKKKSTVSDIFSIVAIILSLYTLHITRLDKRNDEHSNLIKTFKLQVDNLKSFERDYQLQLQNASDYSKTIISSIYFSKVNQLTNEISFDFYKNIYDDIEPSLLNDCAIYFKQADKTKEAINFSLLALKKSKDNFTKGVTYRNLANFYSIEGDSQNIIKSRTYHFQELNIVKNFPGDFGITNTVQSFIIWADDEFINLKDIKFANNLLDSAEFYTNRLNKNDLNKVAFQKTIQGKRNYFNGLFNPMNSTWEVFNNSQKIGSAYFSYQSNIFNLNIDLKRKDSLYKQISSSGNYISFDKLKFTGIVVFESDLVNYQPKENPFTHMVVPEKVIQKINKQKNISMLITINKDNTIEINYYELGETVQNWHLKFVETF